MAKIEDIQKLRPELLDKSTAELERQMTELKMALEYKAAEGERKQREALVVQAAADIDEVLPRIKRLHAGGFLNEKLVVALSNDDGTFAPHLRFKKPKS